MTLRARRNTSEKLKTDASRIFSTAAGAQPKERKLKESYDLVEVFLDHS